MSNDDHASFNNLVDLASVELGGAVVLVSDDYFASKDNINQPGRGSWDPDLFYERGKVYDGWESRRNRHPDNNDWLILRLARRGVIKVADIDTNHFLGNAPQFASLEVTGSEQVTEDNMGDVDWTPVLPPSSLRPGSQNLFLLDNFTEATHVRLQIYPDGGVARLRLYGTVTSEQQGETDYASLLNGGRAVLASDMFFGGMRNLLKPNAPENMGDGWETKRRRGAGNDWVIIRLGMSVQPSRIVVDTTHFKGNYPDHCSIEVCNEPALQDHRLVTEATWHVAVADYKLGPDRKHVLTGGDLDLDGPVTHIRLNIFPDGGVVRFRVYA